MIGAPKKAAAPAAPAAVTPQKLDTNEQARPIPYFAGRRWFPLTWIVSTIYNVKVTPITSKVGKSTKTTGYIYGGDVAGLVCLGPVDWLELIEVDGQVIWSGGIERDSGHFDNTGDIVVPGSDTGCGTYRLHWGTETQTQANFIVCGAGAPETHPDYLGLCFLEIKSLVFGEGRTTPPNIRVLVERAPRFGGLLDENRTREGANGITSLAEVIGNDFYGLGRPDLVDVTSWNALCTDIQRPQTQAVPGDPTHTAVMGYCSPYIESAETLQSFAGKILEAFDGWIRRKAGTATLEIGRFPHDGVVPTGLLELTLHDLADKPQFDSPGFSDQTVITDAIVKGLDRDWNMEPTSEIGSNSAARQRLGERRMKNFERPFLHTSYQKKAQANELSNFYARPETSVTNAFRREKVLTLLPGDRFIFNWGPSSFRQVMRVTNRRDPSSGGTIELTYIGERGLAPLGYVATGQAAPTLPTPPAPAAITAARMFQLPIGFLADPSPAVVPLASRPTENTLGHDLYFSTDDITYDAVAQTERWALHGGLGADIVAGTASFNVAVTGPELALLATQSPAAQEDNTLLLICGFEIMSIGAVVAGGGGIYTVDVLRGRLGSAAASHAASTDDVYIIPRGDLQIVQNANFPRTAVPQYFKLRAFTPQDPQPLSSALRIVFNFANAVTPPPTAFVATADIQAIFLTWTLPALPDGTPDPTIVMAEIFEKAHGAATPLAGDTPDFEQLGTSLHRGSLTAGTQRDYYIRLRDTIDDKSVFVGPATATAGAAPTGATGASGATGQRGSKHFYGTASSWSDATANATITAAGLTKVLLDEVTLSNGTNYAETRFWDGSVWATIAEVIDGNLLVNGTVGAAKIVTPNLAAINADLGTVTAGKITASATIDVGTADNRVQITPSGLSVGLVTVNGASNQNTIAISGSHPIQITGGTATASFMAGVGATMSGINDISQLILGNTVVATNNSGVINASLVWIFGTDIKTSGDIYLGQGGVNRWLYDCNGDRVLQERYSSGNPGASSDATAEWCRQVILHHGLGF